MGGGGCNRGLHPSRQGARGLPRASLALLARPPTCRGAACRPGVQRQAQRAAPLQPHTHLFFACSAQIRTLRERLREVRQAHEAQRAQVLTQYAGLLEEVGHAGGGEGRQWQALGWEALFVSSDGT